LSPIDFHSMEKEKKNYGIQWGPTEIQVWNNLRVSKWSQNFSFWSNYPFENLIEDMIETDSSFWLV